MELKGQYWTTGFYRNFANKAKVHALNLGESARNAPETWPQWLHDEWLKINKGAFGPILRHGIKNSAWATWDLDSREVIFYSDPEFRTLFSRIDEEW